MLVDDSDRPGKEKEVTTSKVPVDDLDRPGDFEDLTDTT